MEAQDLNNDKKTFQSIVKPVIVGVSGYLISSLIIGGNRDIQLPFIQTEIPIPLFFGALEAGISLLTEPVSLFVLPYISKDSDKTMSLLNPAIHAVLSYSFLSYEYPQLLKAYGATTPLAIGALSEFSGDYLNDFALKFL